MPVNFNKGALIITLVITFILSGFSIGFTKPDISNLTFKLGATEKYLHQQNYNTFPALQIGGRLTPVKFNWALFGGFWDEGIPNVAPEFDGIVYSRSSYITGARIYGNSPKRNFDLITLCPFLGFAHHFVNEEYISGYYYNGQKGVNRTIHLNSVDVGMNIIIKINKTICLTNEVQKLILIHKESYMNTTSRWAFTSGFTYSF